ncbi:response regulator, partial [Candidatus Aerophobetes bacterium]|nr:response regulator [Candidatus Aerophobetes bacterium]
RRHKEIQDVPIIMLTAIRERMDIKWKIQPDEEWLPVTEFLEKPVAPEKLTEKVEEMLKRKKK